jgi:hypothetical protein
MKILAAISTLALTVVCACHSAPPAPAVPEGQRIGQEVQPQQSVRFSVVDATPAKFYDKTVLVEANVKAVCAKKGCWMQVEDEGRTATVRWESGCGGQYKFPMEAVGKRVLVQGTFHPKKLSAAEAQHMQAEAGDAKVAIAPEGYEFNASSVIILDG